MNTYSYEGGSMEKVANSWWMYLLGVFVVIFVLFVILKYE